MLIFSNFHICPILFFTQKLPEVMGVKPQDGAIPLLSQGDGCGVAKG